MTPRHSRSNKSRRQRGKTSQGGDKQSQTTKTEFSIWKKIFFALVATALFFAVLESVLFLVGVESISFRTDPYVGFSSYAPLFVNSAEAGTRQASMPPTVSTADNKMDWFNRQDFARSKPPKTYRIFCVGGSTTYGRPYSDKTSFAGWLRELLPVADESRRWEIINAGGVSYASYRVARLMEELIEYEPDLFLIYCGHNEFLERRTYASIIETPQSVRDFESILSRTRTYSLLKRLIDGESARLSSNGDLLTEEVKSILDKSVGPEVYQRDDRLQQQVLAHYRYNLIRMIEIASSAGARTIFVTPASNLRSCAPFKSEHRADLNEQQRWRALELLRAAEQAASVERFDEALRLVEEGLAIDDLYAQLHYVRGQILWRLQRYQEARIAFIHARDEDVCPLRALTPMGETLLQLSKQFGAPVIDFAALIDDQSEHGIPGDDWFLDHVHPTIFGNRFLALAVIDALSEEGILRFSLSWGDDAVKRVAERIEGQIDHQAHATALRNLSKVLGWAGKRDEGEQLAIRALADLPNDPEAEYQAGSAYLNRNDFDNAIERFQRSLELRPNNALAHFGLAKALESKQDFSQAIAHYLQAIALDPNDEDPHYNLARVYERIDDLERASEHYRAAIAINPEHFFSHNNLGSLLAGQNRLDEAQEHFLAAVEAKSDLSHTHVNLGLIYEMKGQAKEAAASFRAALKSQPNHFGAAFHLVGILATHPDASVRDGATAVYWAKRLAYSPEMAEFWGGHRPAEFQQPVVLSLLAAAFAEAGDFQQAVGTQQAAIDLLPVNKQRPYKALLELYRNSKPYTHEQPVQD